jgi:membrane protein YdbS with pleckstrin-like domain
MIEFNIIRDFNLSTKPKYRDVDVFVNDTCRKGKFSTDLAEKNIVEYLKDNASITLSWSVLLLCVCVLSLVVSLILPIMIINIVVVLSFVSSIYFFKKFKYKMNNFDFDKSMLMTMNSMLGTIQ